MQHHTMARAQQDAYMSVDTQVLLIGTAQVPSEVSSTIGRAAQQGRPFLDQLNQFIGSNGFNTDQVLHLSAKPCALYADQHV